MGRGDEQKPLMQCIRREISIDFRSSEIGPTTSPKQWYLQIGMLDVCGSLESTLLTKYWYQLGFFFVTPYRNTCNHSLYREMFTDTKIEQYMK